MSMATGKTMKFSGNGQAGNLSDPTNWVRGVTPAMNDTALITKDVGGPVAGTFSVNNMMLLGSETITFTGVLDTAGVGACKGLMVCDGATAVFAPGATLNDGNVLIVGNDAVGSLRALGGGTTRSTINTVDANVGKQDAGVGAVTIDDADWTNTGHAYIGDKGTGTLQVIDHGAFTIGGSLDMAAATGSNGTLTIATGGSVTVTGGVRVGGAAATHGIAGVSVGSGSSLTADRTLSVGTGSELDIAGGTVTGGVSAGCIETLSGGVIAGFGKLSLSDGMAIDDDGTIRASGGSLEVDGNIGGAGTVQIAANSAAILTGKNLRLAGISFMGAGGTLGLAHGSNVTAPISGFAIGDVIAMANVDAVAFNATTGMLTLSDLGVKVEKLHVLGGFAGDTFAVHQGPAGAMITLQAN